MADEPQSPFMPNFSGPLSGVLEQSFQPPQQPSINPNGRVPRAAAAAALTQNFLAGLEKGRMRKYAVEQAAKQQKVNAVLGQLSRIQGDPTVTDEAKSQVAQAAYQSLFGYAQQQMGDDKGGKGKKDKTPQGPMGNVLGLIRGGLEKFTGGPLPKGTPDIDLGGTLAAMNSIYGPNGKLLPQYSVEGQRAKLNQDISTGIEKAGISSETDARKYLQKYYPQIEKTYGKDAQRFVENFASGYPNYDPEYADARKREDARLSGAPPGPTASPNAPPGSSTNQPKTGWGVPSLTGQQPGPPRAGGPPLAGNSGQPAQSGFTPTGQSTALRIRDSLRLYPNATQVGKPEEVTTVGPDGKSQTSMAHYVIAPWGAGYINDGTGEFMDPSTRSVSSQTKEAAAEAKIAKDKESVEKQIADVNRQLQELELKKTRTDADISARERMLDLRQQAQNNLEEFRQQQQQLAYGRKASGIVTNFGNQAAAAQRKASSETADISHRFYSDEKARQAAMQQVENNLGKQLRDLDSNKSAALETLSRESGLKFNDSGEAVEPDKKKDKPKSGAAGTRAKEIDSFIIN